MMTRTWESLDKEVIARINGLDIPEVITEKDWKALWAYTKGLKSDVIKEFQDVVDEKAQARAAAEIEQAQAAEVVKSLLPPANIRLTRRIE